MEAYWLVVFCPGCLTRAGSSSNQEPGSDRLRETRLAEVDAKHFRSLRRRDNSLTGI